MTDNLLRRAADRLHATHGTPSAPPVVALLQERTSDTFYTMWSTGEWAELITPLDELDHENRTIIRCAPYWRAMPRADYRALFGPVWPDTAERPMGAQTFDLGAWHINVPEPTQAEPDGPALGNVPTGVPCAD